MIIYGRVPSSGVGRHKSSSQSFSPGRRFINLRMLWALPWAGLELKVVAQKQEIVKRAECG